MRILVGAYMVRGPMGPLSWHYIQYAMGLTRLGHDVHVIEDSDDYPECCYDPERGVVDSDPSYGLEYVRRIFDRVGLGDRWAYYDAHDGGWKGAAAERMPRVLAEADLFLNVSGSTPIRPWLLEVPRRAFVDTDPGFRQVRTLTVEVDAELARGHTSFHTYGENFGRHGCTIPDDGYPWRPTRQPVVLDAWPVVPADPGAPFTTVMGWESYKPREYGNLRLEMKATSFATIAELPTRTDAPLELAVGGPTAPMEELARHGWRVRNPQLVAPDPFAFRDYVRASAGELTVAKHGYVVTDSGWFSERSAGYLASGRPVITQDTGFRDLLTTGEGLFAFGDMGEALEALKRVRADYDVHARAAREIAREHFDSDRVLTALLEDALA